MTPITSNDHVSEKQCQERHAVTWRIFTGVFGTMAVFVTIAIYAVTIASSALTMSTNAMIEASQARADARQNTTMLKEIHTDTRELRSALMRIEKGEAIK